MPPRYLTPPEALRTLRWPGPTIRCPRSGTRSISATGWCAASPSGRRACPPSSSRRLAANPDGLALIDRRRAPDLCAAGRARRTALPRASPRTASGAGDRVALLLGNGAPFVIALLACARLGAIAVPLNVREQQRRPRLHAAAERRKPPDPRGGAGRPPARPRAPCRCCGHRIAIEGRTFDALLEETPAPAPAGPPSGRGGHGGDPLHLGHHRPAQGRDADPPQHRPFGRCYYALCMGLDAPSDRSLLAVPASHVIGLVATLLAMVHVGGSTVLMPTFKARRLPRAGGRGADHRHQLWCRPMYNLCLLEPDFGAFDLSVLADRAATAARRCRRRRSRASPSGCPASQLMNAYGATETTSAISLMPLGQTARRRRQRRPARAVRRGADHGRGRARGAAGRGRRDLDQGPMVVRGYLRNPIRRPRDAFVARLLALGRHRRDRCGRLRARARPQART